MLFHGVRRTCRRRGAPCPARPGRSETPGTRGAPRGWAAAALRHGSSGTAGSLPHPTRSGTQRRSQPAPGPPGPGPAHSLIVVAERVGDAQLGNVHQSSLNIPGWRRKKKIKKKNKKKERKKHKITTKLRRAGKVGSGGNRSRPEPGGGAGAAGGSAAPLRSRTRVRTH